MTAIKTRIPVRLTNRGGVEDSFIKTKASVKDKVFISPID